MLQTRSVSCENQFGYPVPLSECDPIVYHDTIAECPYDQCLEDYYYVLGDWSDCSQDCSAYDQDTGLHPTPFPVLKIT